MRSIARLASCMANNLTGEKGFKFEDLPFSAGGRTLSWLAIGVEDPENPNVIEYVAKEDKVEVPISETVNNYNLVVSASGPAKDAAAAAVVTTVETAKEIASSSTGATVDESTLPVEAGGKSVADTPRKRRKLVKESEKLLKEAAASAGSTLPKLADFVPQIPGVVQSTASSPSALTGTPTPPKPMDPAATAAKVDTDDI